MNENDRREAFRIWAYERVTPNNTIDNYIVILDEDFPRELNIESIFTITDINELTNLYGRCSVGKDLHTWNQGIGNGRPKSAIGKYIKYIKFTCLQNTMERYDDNSADFNLNNAYWFYRINGRENLYPIKAICRECREVLNLDEDFTTEVAKRALRNIFSTNDIVFKDTNNEQNIEEEFLGDNLIKNIILHGSPGVGKTHNTKKLISLIESGKSDREIFETIKKNELNDVVDIDDIRDRVKFITFHQSFGYEDFIEGFRPNEEGKIELEDGIFKNICDDAQINFIRSIKYKFTLEQDEKKEKLFELFIDEVENEIDKNEKYYINSTVYITSVEGDAFRYQGANWKNSQRMKFDDIKLIYDFHGFSRKDIKKIPNISGLAKQHATYFAYLATKLLEFSEYQNIQIDEIEKEERKKFYLVIDEINRGNISKIFGELITLIEEDKRDTLEVTLPYSKNPFKIPSNLYIIGTMNSTDKSIALIDIALRRRFTFLKMEPNLDLVKNDRVKDIMKKLNEKITETLGVDYVLGHSYFMKIENDDDLDFVLEYKIKPLLEEYFYGDEQGLQSVMDIIDPSP